MIELILGYKLKMKSCTSNADTQNWRVNERGVLRRAVDKSKYIIRNGTTLIIGDKCKKLNSNMFMYDATDSSLFLKRNGSKPISVNPLSNEVFLGENTV